MNLTQRIEDKATTLSIGLHPRFPIMASAVPATMSSLFADGITEESVAHAKRLLVELVASTYGDGAWKKAGRADSVPSSDAILGQALGRLGFARIFENDSLSGLQHLELLQEIRLIARAWLRAEAEKVLEVAQREEGGGVETISSKALAAAVGNAITKFFKRAASYLREVFAAGVLALSGPGELTAVESEALDRNHAVQLAYLEDFRRQIVAEQRPLSASFPARAELYGNAAWGIALDIQREKYKADDVYTEERRILGDANHCDDCPPLSELGWQPIGSLPMVGQTDCRVNCACWFEYR